MGIYTKKQLIAWDLAVALDDKKHFGFYATLAGKYPESRLRKTLAEVQEIKKWSSIKNKGAYFIRSFLNSQENFSRTITYNYLNLSKTIFFLYLFLKGGYRGVLFKNLTKNLTKYYTIL